MEPNKKKLDKRTQAVLKNLQKFLKLLESNPARFEVQKKNNEPIQLCWKNWMMVDSMNSCVNTLIREIHLN